MSDKKAGSKFSFPGLGKAKDETADQAGSKAAGGGLSGLFGRGKSGSGQSTPVQGGKGGKKSGLVEQLRARLKPNKPVLGIDISSMAVKVLEFSHDGDGYKVESYGVEPLPPNAISEHNIADVDGVAEAIRRVVRRAKTKTKDAAVAVPASAVITKTIQLVSAPSDAEMAGLVELEAPKYIPFPLSEINYDFEVIGPSEHDPEMVDVLLVASRAENVDMRSAALELAGLNAKVVDVESYALEHALTLMAPQMPNHGKDVTIALVDVGAVVTSVSVVRDMEIIYSREQDFGGKQLTEEIMRRFGMSYEEAGMAKRMGGLPPEYQREVLEPFKAAMAQQVLRALQFFNASNEQEDVDQVILAGGSAAIAGVAAFISHQVGLPVVIANPLANMALSDKVQRGNLSADAPALLTACGLAMRGFD
ncbi:MAG: pilus assembly protein PilM [Gammaproteobacteria bacterium]|nr:pilus assembly protein PilM [Gammaproteobacteria bacterium]